MPKIACVFNIAAHYREPIYKLIDEKFDCDFYIGDTMRSNIKIMNYESLCGFTKLLQNKFLGKFYWQKGVDSLLKKRYDYIILTGEFYCISTWAILFICYFTKTKTILWTHGWYGCESYFKKKIKSLFFRLSSKVMLYGNYARDLMIKEGFDSSKLEVIYNSLDYQVQSKIPFNTTMIYQNYFGNSHPVLIYVGRVQKVKRLDLLIEALDLLCKQNRDFNLIIVGQQDRSNEIENIVISKQLQNKVWFYGPCFDENKLAELISNASICVSPGNVGLTAIHSLTFGTPVITHNNYVNQMPEFEVIEDGISGGFFIEDNVESLVETILKVSKMGLKINDIYPVVKEKFNPFNQIRILQKHLV